MTQVIALNIYPVKSLQGIVLNSSTLELPGLRHDRRYMIIDRENRFVTQRELPAMATIKTQVSKNNVILQNDKGDDLMIESSLGGEKVTVTIWQDEVVASLVRAEINESLSDMLSADLRLVFMEKAGDRLADETYAKKGKPVSFADGFPVLIANEASLTALNDEITSEDHESVDMARFRANIVIDGDMAWDEDSWKVVKIGNIIFDAVKPCTRCIVTTRDQTSGVGDENNQPIKALSKLRRSKADGIRGFLFGVNLVPREVGEVSVGDSFEVLERRDEPWPVGL